VNRPGAGGGGEQWAGGGNSPGWANRPGAGGGGEQWAGGGNRPGWANRPGAGGGEQWPGSGNRPNWPQRPDVGRWSGDGNRPGWANRPDWSNGSNNIVNRPVNITSNQVFNNQNWNQLNNVNHSWGYDHYQGNYAGWHSGYWNNWHATPSAWYGAGLATGAASSWMYNAGPSYAYSNPLYVAPTYASDSAVDYSQPIQVPSPAPVNVNYSYYADAPASSTEPAATTEATTQYYGEQPAVSPPAATESSADSVPSEAREYFDLARAGFKNQDYVHALADIDSAIKALNSDATMHEFRALVLFAQKKYKESAAGIYAVLSVGPGWNWETMSALYDSPSTYTKQLRDLESYQTENPNAPEGHFLLAYHYLVLGHTERGISQLEKFAQLVPSDKLAPQLIKAFTAAPTDKPTAQAQ
jgi:hypothetical protein